MRIIAEKISESPERWRAYVDDFPRVKVTSDSLQDAAQYVLTLICVNGFYQYFPRPDGKYETKIPDLIRCERCGGRGEVALFQLPEKCEPCNGYGALMPCGDRIVNWVGDER